MYRETGRQTDRRMEVWRDRQNDVDTEIQRDRRTEGWRYGGTDRMM
jgi:hypothetical protein